MAKAKTYKKRYYKKGRWSSNITKLENTLLTVSSGNWSASTDLCENPAQTNSTVSQQFTVKNVELTFQLELDVANSQQNIESVTVYIMYVPQGMTIGDDYHLQHPEYIMAYRFIGSPELDSTNGIRNPLRVKTRLARRLQTGDKIIAYFEGTNTSTNDLPIRVNGLIRWWTKAN